MRHPKTDTTQADTDTLHLENCAAQRALLPEGRETAKAIGEAFRALIPAHRASATVLLFALGERARALIWSSAGAVDLPSGLPLRNGVLMRVLRREI